MIAAATCPRCQHTNELLACQNCGGTDYRRGPLSDGSEGMICQGCNLGFAHIPCQAGCGALISARSFGTPMSRLAGRAQAGMTAYEGGKCFIATELYGSDSIEVAILRRLRDQVLLKHRLGARFVTTYYRIAPRIIPVMRQSIVVRLLFHTPVALLVFVIKRTPLRSGARELPQRSVPCGRLPV